MFRPIGILISFGLLASPGRVITFDTYALGKKPPGWTFSTLDRGGPARWEVVKDLTAPTQPNVLAQTSSEAVRDRFPMAILEGLALRDGDVSVRIKPVAGSEDQGGGLVWRYRDENNYYLVRANAINKSVAVFKVQDGRRSVLRSGSRHELPSNRWSLLKVSARGRRFQIYVDHRRIMEGEDSTFTGSGKVGLLTLTDSVMYFDDFRVYPK
jgi:hypothetical protein